MAGESRKVVILGLDGATFDVLLPRVERGEMPNLAALLEEGMWGGLQSTTPPFSAQAWVSLATGKNQAKHGIVDFWERAPDLALAQRRNFVNARMIRGETLWQIAGRQGLSVGVLNVPVTYPPSAVNGYLVSGLLTPQGKEDFAFPPELRQEIEALVPGYNPDPFDPLGTSRQQVLEIEKWMRRHEEVSRYVVDRYPSDLFFSVVQALDFLQHLYWSDVVGESGTGRYREVVNRCYALADQIIGHRRGLMNGQATLILVSDHGFGPVSKRFYVNGLLRDRGLLVVDEAKEGKLGSVAAYLGLTPERLRGLIRRLDVLGMRRWVGRLARVALGQRIDSALTPAIDWGRTQAVSGSPATEGIFVNLKGREPRGIVEPGAPYEALREELMAELMALRDPETHKPVVRTVYRREDLYEGPYLDLLPDVVFDLGDGPYLATDAFPSHSSWRERGGGETAIEALPRDILQGRHRSTGIFVAAGPHIQRSGNGRIEGARIVDVAPTVLYSLGLPIPEDMDGRPLQEIFTDAYRAAHPVCYSEPESVGESELEPEFGPEYDDEDAAEMERRLRGLGYVG